MSRATFYIGDTLEVTRTLPNASVDLILTSPPFLALRSYLPADHPDKAKEIGSEPTPADFIDTLLSLTAEWRRVLAPHGSLCVELGDTYSGSGGAGGDYAENGWHEGQGKFRQQRGGGWPLAKSLTFIPEAYRMSLVYGWNVLRRNAPDSPAGQWRARNVVRWHRPNPPVGALGDKFRPATTDMVVACVSGRRYFDLDAVRGPGSENTHARTAVGVASRERTAKTAPDGNRQTLAEVHDTNGAPPLDTWIIPTQPYRGAHYATFPQDLCVRPIKSMCPEKVCWVCGVPSVRIVQVAHEFGETSDSRGRGQGSPSRGGEMHRVHASDSETLGWSDCGHDDWRPGVTFDPFAGSGTTLQVATGHGRDAIGIDLDERNADLARDRIGMFLDVIDTRAQDGAA